MKMAVIVAASVVALALVPLAHAQVYLPPVCHTKEVGALGSSVEVWITCGPHVTITYCPLDGSPCTTKDYDLLA